MEGAGKVGVYAPMTLKVAYLPEMLGHFFTYDPSAVHQNIYLAPLVYGFINHIVDLVGLGDIGRE